jgi:hypothetical protein
MRKTAILATAALAALALPPAGIAQPMYSGGNRPVMLTGGEGLDPCAYGMINDPPTGPDTGAVMVFPGDSTDLDYADTLVHGDPVWVCEASEDWLGIVYSRNSDLDCELSSPVAEDRPYLGPCDWGWVKAEWVEIVAG